MPGEMPLAPLGLHAIFGKRARNFAEIGVRRDLESQARQRIAPARLERDRLKPHLAGEKGAILGPLDQREADDLGVIGDLPVDIRRRQRGVAQSFDADHRYPPDAARGCCGGSA